MRDDHDVVRTAVSAVKTTNDEELFRLLGARMKAIAADPSTAGVAEPNVSAAARGITTEDLLKFGKDAFGKISVAGQAVICGSGADQGMHLQRLLGSFNTDLNRVVVALTGVLVAQLAIAPAVASVVATLVIGKVAPTSIDALCRVWGAKVGSTLPTTTVPGPTPPPPATSGPTPPPPPSGPTPPPPSSSGPTPPPPPPSTSPTRKPSR